MIRFDHDICGDLGQALRREWLETNGLGGFASSTIVGLNTRRYHALLVAALDPPSARFVLLAKLEETVVVGDRRYEISANRYPGVIHPNGQRWQTGFRLDPFPTFTWDLDGTVVEKSVLLVHGEDTVVVTYAVSGAEPAPVRLEVRPLIAFRDFHATVHENDALDARVTVAPGVAAVTPYAGLPTLHVAHDAVAIDQRGEWYRSFEYEAERERGLDFREDLFHPFTLTFDLGARGSASLVAGTGRRRAGDASGLVRAERERRAALLATIPAEDGVQCELVAAADRYVVARGAGRSIIAGYPWFGDWGRDTFIALRGLCLATGRLDVARDILLAWSGVVDRGMLPNRFPDHGEPPEFNSVDAALWFVVAVHDYCAAAAAAGRPLPRGEEDGLWGAVEAILDGYVRGTRYAIGVDAADGLVFAGESGVQLTWMDAKVGDRVVTPRIGKPVEVQALWLATLEAAGARSDRWRVPLERGRASFVARFWNPDGGYLHDVVDADGKAGAVDDSFRPNQIFAVGGLPVRLLDDARARRVVDGVESRLLTPLGLRSLAPGSPGYVERYAGGVRERDSAYHQGTVWPWLLGPFVEAWVRVRGGGAAVKAEARRRFVAPLERHLEDAGLGHVSEIADAAAPYEPRGCPFQAWSVGELLRLVRSVLV